MEAGRLRWRCQRGSRELELMLLDYLENHYPQADLSEQTDFQRLLELPEDRLQHYLLGQEDPVDTSLAKLGRRIRTTFNADA